MYITLMAEKDVALAIMGAALGLAGLLLVFSGFLLARSAQYESKRGDKYRYLAKLAMIPTLLCFACTLVALWSVQGGSWSEKHLYDIFKAVLAVSALYAIVGLYES